ncbi:hypothetical protein LCGC14_1268420 [marine sediment metagenome]|uniref:Uncharacterized protein n=1 Tax=marine sediment metagenome TaxID=412755 RepID=A0A0F9NFJ2_9ZZZZ|nr:hypothetical protein [Desulfobacterales bacterium]
MRVEIDMGWISTSGIHFPVRCEIVTDDEGETFYCQTHQQATGYEEECPTLSIVEDVLTTGG